MTSTNPEQNLPPDDSAASQEERTIGGKASLDQIYLIDRAVLELRQKRGPFIVEAAVAKARLVLEELGIDVSGQPSTPSAA